MKLIKTNFPQKTTREALCAMLERDLKHLKNKTVLEIGCGTWDFAKKILERNRCKWYGVEPVGSEDKNITLIKGSVEDLPFHNNSFDLVLCNQSMEHWFEYGVSFRKALKEINRVLKPGGVLMMNVPIHVHGHPYFLRGDLRNIARLFDSKLWSIQLMERCLPSKDVLGWRKISATGWMSKIGYPSLLLPYKKAFSYQLNIHVKKRNRTPTRSLANSRYRPFVVILRFCKEMFLGRF